MTTLPLDATGRRPAFFDQPGIDQLVSMVLELATELWVVRERQFVMEAALADQGLDLSAAMEEFTPTPAQTATLAQLRAEMTGNLFRTLGRVTP